jgi:hypothetical protein
MESLFLKSLWNLPKQNILKNLSLNICRQCISSNEEKLLENMFSNDHEWCLDYFFKNSKYHSILQDFSKENLAPKENSDYEDEDEISEDEDEISEDEDEISEDEDEISENEDEISEDEFSDYENEISEDEYETTDYETSDSEINEEIVDTNYINLLKQFNKNNEKLLEKFSFMNSITKQLQLFKKYCQPNLFYKNLYSEKIEKLLDEKISSEQIRNMKKEELEKLLSMIQIN